MEDPFTTQLGFWLGANRLNAPLMQAHFDERLLALCPTAAAPWPEGEACYSKFIADAIGEPVTDVYAAPPPAKAAGGGADETYLRVTDEDAAVSGA